MRRALGVACAGVLLLAGCGEGGAPGDLFVVERDGSVPGARLTLRLSNDGGAYCNDLPRKELTSDQLLEARALRRELIGEEPEEAGPADRGARYPPGRRTIFSFRVITEDGTVRFSDTSTGLEAIPRIVKLTRDVAREQCGLDR